MITFVVIFLPKLLIIWICTMFVKRLWSTCEYRNVVYSLFFRDIFHLDNLSAYLRHCANVSFRHEIPPVQKSFLRLEEKLKGSYSLYLMNKRARRVRVKQEQNPETGSHDIIGTSINHPADYIHRPQLHPAPSADKGPRWLFHTLRDNVIAIDSSEPVKAVNWFPLDLSLPRFGGRGCDCYHPLPSSLSGENVQYLFVEKSVSSSQLFLLKFAAGLLNVPLLLLVSRVIDVEQILRRHGFLAMTTRNAFKKTSQL